VPFSSDRNVSSIIAIFRFRFILVLLDPEAHPAKKAVLPLAVLAWVIYLALPFSLHPTFVVLSFATLFALTVVASTFKKYL